MSLKNNDNAINATNDALTVPSADSKKTLTAREAVRLFAKLIAEEKAKKTGEDKTSDAKLSGGLTDGDRQVAALHAGEKMSSVNVSKIRPFGEPGVVGEICILCF